MTALLMQYLVPILSVLGGLIALVLAAFSVGKSKEKVKATEALKRDIEKRAAERVIEAKAAANKQVEIIKGANDVKNDVNKLDNNSATDELRNEWQRD